MKQFKYSLVCLALILGGCGGGSDSNSAPEFSQSNYALSVAEDGQARISVSASDKDNDALTYSLSNAAANGTVTVNAKSGGIDYQPNPNFNGSDSFVVAVSDGESTATTTVKVTVTAVNDAPVISSAEVVVSGGETKQGQVKALDVDGDTISYSVSAAASNGTLTLDAVTGAISYRANNLSLINDAFELTVTDGKGGSHSQQITISAATASNVDRAYYYYASDRSHLKRAEAINALLTDDENQSLINANLVRGYAAAGLTAEVEARLKDSVIVSDTARALAMVDVANSYQAAGLTDQARTLRNQANTLYTQHIASKGVAAFNADDVNFYKELSLSFRYAGDFSGANQAFSILDLLFASLAEDGYSTSILRTFFSFRNIVKETVERWQVSGDADLFKLALSQTEHLLTYAKLIPAQEVTNNRHGNEGKFTYKIRQVALFDVIEAYIELDKLDEAKSVMADLLALHGVVNYDENYRREVDQHWQVTRVEYEYGAVGATKPFVTLYPTKGAAPILAALPEGSFWARRVEKNAADALLIARVRNMEDQTAALQLIKDAKEDDNLRNYFTNLVAFKTSVPGAALTLRKQGNYQAALSYLQEGLNVLTMPEYFAQNSSDLAFNLGATGCELLIKEALLVARLSALPVATEFAQSAVAQCAQLAMTNYKEGDDSSETVTVGTAIKANAYMLQFADELDMSGITSELLATIDSNFAKIAGDHTQNFNLQQFVGWQLAKGGFFSKAQNYYNNGIAALNGLEKEAVAETAGELTEKFFSYSRKEGDYAEYLAVLENAAGKAGYATGITAARAAWQAVIDARLAELDGASQLQKAEFLPIYARQLSRIREYDQALGLVADDALGSVEINGIRNQVASSLSLKDDFPSEGLATVDTDMDGMPNFFAPSATQEQITVTGLTLDADSDNDGTNDGEDAYPLDPQQQ